MEKWGALIIGTELPLVPLICTVQGKSGFPWRPASPAPQDSVPFWGTYNHVLSPMTPSPRIPANQHTLSATPIPKQGPFPLPVAAGGRKVFLYIW